MAENGDLLDLARLLLSKRHGRRVRKGDGTMKLESIATGATWLLMNALLVMVAVEPLSLIGDAAAPAAYSPSRA